MIKFFAFLVVFFLLVGVGSVCVGQLVNDTSIIFMSGSDWSLKVDGVLQSSLDSRNVPYMTSKSVFEKELFLELATFEDCKSGVVQFKVDTQGLTAYKQLPLDLELNVKEYEFVNSTHALNNSEVLVYRPENIVNSFALFDDLGRKQAHISASKLVDAGGAIIWCDSNLEGGLLTVVLPLGWLEFAKFPVLLDPVFGQTNIGGTETTIVENKILVNIYSLTENASIVDIMLYCKASSGTSQVDVGIYDTLDENSLSYLLGTSGNKTVTSVYSWVGFPLVYPFLSIRNYGLAVNPDTTIAVKYDAGGSTDCYQTKTTSVWVNPFGSPTYATTNIVSIYAEYDVYASPSPSPMPSVTQLPISEGEVSNAMLFVLGFMVVMCVVGLVWLSRVPVVVLLVGLFAVLVGLYCALGGVYSLGVAQGWFSLFTALFGGLTMLLVGLGVRVRK